MNTDASDEMALYRSRDSDAGAQWGGIVSSLLADIALAILDEYFAQVSGNRAQVRDVVAAGLEPLTTQPAAPPTTA